MREPLSQRDLVTLRIADPIGPYDKGCENPSQNEVLEHWPTSSASKTLQVYFMETFKMCK